jgi:hypothetical protein
MCGFVNAKVSQSSSGFFCTILKMFTSPLKKQAACLRRQGRFCAEKGGCRRQNPARRVRTSMNMLFPYTRSCIAGPEILIYKVAQNVYNNGENQFSPKR